jgi:hypothetical protein
MLVGGLFVLVVDVRLWWITGFAEVLDSVRSWFFDDLFLWRGIQL